jgi:hypothetical protein
MIQHGCVTASDDNPGDRGPYDVLDGLAPLTAAQPPPSNGRVRSLQEARAALRIPTSSKLDVLRAWGIPQDGHLVVQLIADTDEPGLVAEFATLRVITRVDNKLGARDPGRRLRLSEKSNALWIVYGSIVIAADRSLVIESLAIGPAFAGQLTNPDDETALGITGELLRLISPPTILTACAEQLAWRVRWYEQAVREGTAAPLTALQEEHLARIDQGRPPRAQTPDDQLAAIATRYLTLLYRGNTRPRKQLAEEFGLTTTQIRDRLHQAREREYLVGGTQGRAGAAAGPRLQRPDGFVTTANIHT